MPVTKISELPASSPLAQPVAVQDEGTYVHEPSGFVFPPAVGAFERVALTRYDTAGLDVSAGYNANAPGCPVRQNIYVAPAPRMSWLGADPAVVKSQEQQWLTSACERWKREIMDAHTQARLISEDSRIQDGVPGRKAVYSIGADESRLYVFLIDRTWFLTYRHTYPTECGNTARELIDGFMTGWQRRKK